MRIAGPTAALPAAPSFLRAETTAHNPLSSMNLLFWALIASLVLLLQTFEANAAKTVLCPANASCWPNAEALETRATFGGWGPYYFVEGKPAPIPSSVPLYSPYNQPLYGVGSTSSLQALYIRPSDFQGGCFVSGTPERRLFCLVATRNIH